MSRIRLLLLLTGIVALALAAATSAAPPARDGSPNPPVDGGVQNPDGEIVRAPSACSTPTTQTIRGKSVIFDQCYQRDFSHDGTNYSI